MAEQRVPVTAYPIRGLDCAQCAATIESELRSRPGMEEAAVSFATSTIYLPADRLDEAQQIISRVEPEARLAEGAATRTAPISALSGRQCSAGSCASARDSCSP
jgi:Cu+-exporting ATPase